jgi:drug/metabolite transporter (DMT)-like permease
MKHTQSLRAEYIIGATFSFLSVIATSSFPLFTEQAHLPVYTVMVWIALFMTITLSALFFLIHKGASFSILRTGGWKLYLSGVFWGVSIVGFSLGILRDNVALTLIGLSCTPIITSILRLIFFQKRPSFVTFLATVYIIAGISFIFGGELSSLTLSSVLWGISTPIFIATTLTFTWHNKEIKNTAALSIGSLIAFLLLLPISRGNLSFQSGHLWPLIVVGSVILPFSLLMICKATRYISSTQISLILLLSPIVGMIYLWICTNISFPADFIMGSFILLIAIIANSVYQVRLRKALEEQMEQ